MPDQKPRLSAEDHDFHEKLRDKGNRKEKSARVANSPADASRSQVGHQDGESPSNGDGTLIWLYLETVSRQETQ